MGRRSGPHRKKDQKKYQYKKKYKTPNIALSPTNGPDHTGRKTRLFCPPLKVTRRGTRKKKRNNFFAIQEGERKSTKHLISLTRRSRPHRKKDETILATTQRDKKRQEEEEGPIQMPHILCNIRSCQ